MITREATALSEKGRGRAPTPPLASRNLHHIHASSRHSLLQAGVPANHTLALITQETCRYVYRSHRAELPGQPPRTYHRSRGGARAFSRYVTIQAVRRAKNVVPCRNAEIKGSRQKSLRPLTLLRQNLAVGAVDLRILRPA